MQVIPATDRISKRAAADYFTGVVWQEEVVVAPEPARIRGLRVTFEPGARTNWHSHPYGQTLIVTDGVGWVQLEGEPAQMIRAGDTVWIQPGERHWHGASATRAMTHYALQEAKDGKPAYWEEPVSDADYAAAG